MLSINKRSIFDKKYYFLNFCGFFTENFACDLSRVYPKRREWRPVALYFSSYWLLSWMHSISKNSKTATSKVSSIEGKSLVSSWALFVLQKQPCFLKPRCPLNWWSNKKLVRITAKQFFQLNELVWAEVTGFDFRWIFCLPVRMQRSLGVDSRVPRRKLFPKRIKIRQEVHAANTLVTQIRWIRVLIKRRKAFPQVDKNRTFGYCTISKKCIVIIHVCFLYSETYYDRLTNT